MLLHTIANLRFIEIQGSLVPRTRQLEVLTRKGRHDAQVRLLAIRGRPVQVTTVNYVPNFQWANDFIDVYEQLKNGVPYGVIQNSVFMGNYFVLGVEEQSREACLNVVGGLFGNERCRHVCQWTLMHTYVDDEDN